MTQLNNVLSQHVQPVIAMLKFNNAWMRLHYQQASTALAVIDSIALAEPHACTEGMISVNTGEGTQLHFVPSATPIKVGEMDNPLPECCDNKPFLPLFLSSERQYFQISHIVDADVNLFPIMRDREDIALLATDMLGNQYLANIEPTVFAKTDIPSLTPVTPTEGRPQCT